MICARPYVKTIERETTGLSITFPVECRKQKAPTFCLQWRYHPVAERQSIGTAAHFLELTAGIEPATTDLQNRRSTVEPCQRYGNAG